MVGGDNSLHCFCLLIVVVGFLHCYPRYFPYMVRLEQNSKYYCVSMYLLICGRCTIVDLPFGGWVCQRGDCTARTSCGLGFVVFLVYIEGILISKAPFVVVIRITH